MSRFAAFVTVSALAACGVGDSQSERLVLKAVLSELPGHVEEFDPTLFFPRRLRILEGPQAAPGVRSGDYSPGDWPALADAVASVGGALCKPRPGEFAGMCSDDGSTGGYISVSAVEMVTPDSAEVFVAATETREDIGYASLYYRIGLRRAESDWKVTVWRPWGSAN